MIEIRLNIKYLGTRAVSMGVDHGGGDGKDKSPQNLERGDCPPPDFVMWQNFKHQITCITM